MFLAEFDLTDNRVTADKFCSIYSYLASRPPTPAAKDAPAGEGAEDPPRPRGEYAQVLTTSAADPDTPRRDRGCVELT